MDQANVSVVTRKVQDWVLPQGIQASDGSETDGWLRGLLIPLIWGFSDMVTFPLQWQWALVGVAQRHLGEGWYVFPSEMLKSVNMLTCVNTD